MKQVSLLHFRRNASRILANVQKGQTLILTRRGRPVAQLIPVPGTEPDADDPFYSITDLAVPGPSLTNDEIDGALYGE